MESKRSSTTSVELKHELSALTHNSTADQRQQSTSPPAVAMARLRRQRYVCRFIGCPFMGFATSAMAQHLVPDVLPSPLCIIGKPSSAGSGLLSQQEHTLHYRIDARGWSQ